eukprot:2638302-Amphidinium_carterae.1
MDEEFSGAGSRKSETSESRDLWDRGPEEGQQVAKVVMGEPNEEFKAVHRFSHQLLEPFAWCVGVSWSLCPHGVLLGALRQRA